MLSCPNRLVAYRCPSYVLQTALEHFILDQLPVLLQLPICVLLATRNTQLGGYKTVWRKGKLSRSRGSSRGLVMRCDGKSHSKSVSRGIPDVCTRWGPAMRILVSFKFGPRVRFFWVPENATPGAHLGPASFFTLISFSHPFVPPRRLDRSCHHGEGISGDL